MYSTPEVSNTKFIMSYPLKIDINCSCSTSNISISSINESSDSIFVEHNFPPNILLVGVAKLFNIPNAVLLQTDLKCSLLSHII